MKKRLADAAPVPGYRVLTMDGVPLGEVDAVGAGQFRVRDRYRSRWLRSDAIFTVEGRRITLVCNVGHIGDYVPRSE